MLQKLNERIQGIIAWVVIILIAGTFTLFGVDYFLQSRQVSDIEVSVNGEGISKQSFETNFRRVRQQRDYQQQTAASERALRKQVLDDLVTNLVTVQSARADGFLVTDAEANQAILNIPQFQQDGQFSKQRYQQALSAALYTPESFKTQVQKGMLLNQQRFAFMGTAFALPNEISRFVKLYMQTRDYDYLVVPVKPLLTTVKVTPEAVQSYYQSHKQDFITPEQLSVEYVRLSSKTIHDQINVTEDDIHHYYQDNESNFMTPAQWQVSRLFFAFPVDATAEIKEEIKQKAEHAYQELSKNPDQFSMWVKSLSSDQTPITNEALSPWIVAGTTPFDKALSALTDAGEVTAPIKTAQGYELFKLIAYKEASLKPLPLVESEIKKQLVSELTEARYTQALEQLTDLSYQTPDSLAPVAATLHLKIEKTPLFYRNGQGSPFAANKQVINAAFSHDVLDLGNNSEPLQFDTDSVIVLRVNQHRAPTQKVFSEVSSEIKSKLELVAAKQAAENMAKQMMQTPKDSLQSDLMKQWQLTWQPIKNAGRDSDASDALVTELAFNLPRVNSMSGRTMPNGDYVIVRLKKVYDGQYASLDREQQLSLAQQIEASYGVMDYDLYVNNLVATAKIERH